MDVDKAQNESGDLIFTKQFLGIAEGSYQYKIRIGEDHWVLDQSTESGNVFLAAKQIQANLFQPMTSRAT